jgi:broad specificity phosphatase PhoE
MTSDIKSRSPEQVTERLDRLIKEIREKFHAQAIGKPVGETPPCDVLLVAHGHILRAFAMRWAGQQLKSGPVFLLEAGGVGTLSYEHHQLNEPAILLGGGFMVDAIESSAHDREMEIREKEGKQ